MHLLDQRERSGSPVGALAVVQPTGIVNVDLSHPVEPKMDLHVWRVESGAHSFPQAMPQHLRRILQGYTFLTFNCKVPKSGYYYRIGTPYSR